MFISEAHGVKTVLRDSELDTIDANVLDKELSNLKKESERLEENQRKQDLWSKVQAERHKLDALKKGKGGRSNVNYKKNTILRNVHVYLGFSLL